jgi:hypothetical protein
MSEIINGQFDQGLKLLLGARGEDSQKDLDLNMELNR